MKLRIGLSVIVGALMLSSIANVGSNTVASAAPLASRYVPVAPTRLFDTRSSTPIAANTTRDFKVTGGLVPEGASAIVVNVTATRSLGGGFLQLLPTGQADVGSSSTLNLDFAGQTIPNAAFAPIGNGGQITVFSTFTTDVLIDVSGYFIPASTATAGRFMPVTPSRILDTRNNIGYTPPTPAPAPAPAPVPVPAPPASPTPPPERPSRPTIDKDCNDFRTQAEAQRWFDTYFPHYGDISRLDADNDGIACEALPDEALSDESAAVEAAADGAIASNLNNGQIVTLQVAGRGGVPSTGASAVVLNVTVASPSAAGFVQVAPTPVVKGAFSNLNPEPGRTIANLVVVPLGSGGKVDLYTELYGPGSLDLLADVVGYFTDSTAPSTSSGLFVPIAPSRSVDTRLPSPQPAVPSGGIVGVDVAAIAPGASAIAGNLTSSGGGAGGYLQLGPSPVTPGAASSLNTSYAGQTIANAVVSPVAAGGAGQVYSYGTTHVLLDVTGWFTG